MSRLPALQVLADMTADHFSGVLKLTLDSSDLSSEFHFQRGVVVGMLSPLLPTWPTSVHAFSNLSAKQPLPRAFDWSAHEFLLSTGLCKEALWNIWHHRLLCILTRLRGQDAEVQTLPLCDNTFLNLEWSVLSPAVLDYVEHLASQMTPQQQALKADDVLRANPLYGGSLGEGAAVYHAALRELSLGEIAVQVPQVWPTLTRQVCALLECGALRQDAAFCQPRHALLSPGDFAPNFCLPLLGGGELQLSDLRGQQVWLTFQRQAGCVLSAARAQELSRFFSVMQGSGVQVLSVWRSNLTCLKESVSALELPFAALADPYGDTHQTYGLSPGTSSVFDIRNISQALRGLSVLGGRARPLGLRGLQLPAEFWLDEEGQIIHAHYNRYGTDWLPLSAVKRWFT